MAKYIVRFDDITDGMKWINFLTIKKVLEEYGISSILGVIPENKDKTLMVHPTMGESQFFSKIKTFAQYGDAIAQHGTFHVYVTKDSGLLKIHNNSEFSGNSYENQFDQLKKGKEILQSHGIWQPYFMAPSHSFDNGTLKSLKKLGFEAITDGYGFYPYQVEGIKLLPQLASKPIKNIPFGVQTICLHTNTMSLSSIEKLIKFIHENSNSFISFQDALQFKCKSNFFEKTTYHISKSSLQTFRKLKGIIK